MNLCRTREQWAFFVSTVSIPDLLRLLPDLFRLRSGCRYEAAEDILQVTDLYNPREQWASFVINAIKAKELFKKEVNYIVKGDEIIIVDEFTGRTMPGRRWSEGLHQAIEAKERVTINNETVTLASVSYQNFFRAYPKLSGMSGTAATEIDEFSNIYNMSVQVFTPPHRLPSCICACTLRRHPQTSSTAAVGAKQSHGWSKPVRECAAGCTFRRTSLPYLWLSSPTNSPVQQCLFL